MNEHPPSWLIAACRGEYIEPEATRLARALWQRILSEWDDDDREAQYEDADA